MFAIFPNIYILRRTKLVKFLSITFVPRNTPNINILHDYNKNQLNSYKL